MKRIKYICLLLLSISIIGCKNYLDIKPFGKVIPKTAEDFATLLNARLNNIDYGMDPHVVGNFREVMDLNMFADDFESCLDYLNSGLKYSVTQILKGPEPFYKYARIYEVIRDCNIIIDNEKTLADNSESLVNEVLSASYALRGVCYYQLLRMYCEPPVTPETQLGVPIVLHFDLNQQAQRSTMAETIKQIETDLLESLKYKSSELYIFTPDVVRGYLARLYFWTKQWSKAIQISEGLIERHPLMSGDAYVEMLTELYGPTGNILLKSPKYRRTEDNQTINSYQSDIKNRPISKRFIECFYDDKANDIRYSSFIAPKRICKKAFYSSMRSAEFLLIAAESYYHIGQKDKALLLINQLREKRLKTYTTYTLKALPPLRSSELIKVDANGNAITPLLNVILTERRKELFFEGDRWFELKRNGRPEFWQSFNDLKYTTLSYMYTYPLPITDIKLIKDFKQNPGYENIIQ